MDEKPEVHEPERRNESHAQGEEQSQSVLWYWFAIAVLVFCWIAEASMCADRGF